MARLRGNRLVRQFPRRQTSWALGPGGTASTTLATSTSTILGAVAFASSDGLTVVRIRGELMLQLLTSSAAAGGFSGAFGIGKATLDATGIGVSALPNPIDDEDWDGWLYHRYYALRSAGVIVLADADAANSVTSSLRLEVDSKAMRKLPENEALFASIQTVESGVSNMTADFNSRVLVKLA